MVRKSPVVAVVAAALVVLAGAIGGGIVLAAGNDTPTPTPTQQGAAPTAPANKPGRQQQMDDYLQKLAANLGIDITKLKGALKQTAIDELDQALKDGKITQAQHDQLKSRIDSGDSAPLGPGIFKGGNPGGRGGFAELGPLFLGAKNGIQDFATWLGTDPATLQKDLAGGKTLAQEAQDHGKSRDDLKQYIANALDTGLKQLVTKGALTQDKADALKKNVTDNLDKIIDGQRPALGPAGPRTFGGGHRGNGVKPNSGNGQQTPTQPGGARGGTRSAPRIVS